MHFRTEHQNDASLLIRLSRMQPSESSDYVAFFVVVVQLFLWVLFAQGFKQHTGGDAAGNGMADGLAVLFFAIPGLILVFSTNLYLAIKKRLPIAYRIVAALNFIGVIFCMFKVYSTW